MKILHRVKGKPVAAWVSQREYGPPDLSDQALVRFIATAIRIHSWVDVRLHGLELRTILALMPGVWRSPGVDVPPLIPFRDDAMEYLSAPSSIGEDIHVIGDPENGDIPDLDSKFIRPGLWFSASLAGRGTLVGYNCRLYIVPRKAKFKLGRILKKKGAGALSAYPSFADPTLDYVDENGDISESRIIEHHSDTASAEGARQSAMSPQVSEWLHIDCPHCGKQLRIPGKYAGQAGKCKKCGERIEVPLASSEDAGIMIEFDCLCGKHYKFKGEMAGRRGKCKQCGEVIEIPTSRPRERH